MKKKIFFVLLVLLVVIYCAAPLYAQEKLNIPVKEYTLKNGLKILIAERHAFPTFSAYILFNTGSFHEPVGLTGVAHMLEHMMFKGSKNIGTINYAAEVPIMDKIDKLLDEIEKEKAKAIINPENVNREKVDKLKAQIKILEEEQKKYVIPNELKKIYRENGGYGLNAYTCQDRTCYHLSLPSNRLELWAYVESDRIKNPVFRMFTSERDVISEERKQRTDTQPTGKMSENHTAALFQAMPYHHPVIGWPTDIENFKAKDVMEVFKKNYSPQNMAIAIVGDVNADRVIKVMEKYFGNIPNYGKVRTVFTDEIPQAGQRRIEVKADSSPIIAIGFHGPKALEKDRFALEVMARILSGGTTARLYKSLVEDKKLLTNVFFGADVLKQGVSAEITAIPVKGADLKRVEDEIFNELDKIKKEKVSAWEIEKAKNNLIAEFIRSLKKNEDLAETLVINESHFGSWRLFDLRAQYEKVTADDIQNAAQKYLNKDNSTVTELVSSKQ